MFNSCRSLCCLPLLRVEPLDRDGSDYWWGAPLCSKAAVERRPWLLCVRPLQVIVRHPDVCVLLTLIIWADKQALRQRSEVVFCLWGTPDMWGEEVKQSSIGKIGYLKEADMDHTECVWPNDHFWHTLMCETLENFSLLIRTYENFGWFLLEGWVNEPLR